MSRVPSRRSTSLVASCLGAALLVATLVVSACSSGRGTSGGASSAALAARGSFVWFDLMTDDPAACQRFYGELFGWSFSQQRVGEKEYLVASIGRRPVAGIVAVAGPTPGEPAKPVGQWVGYLGVANLDAAIEETSAAGGQLAAGPVDVGTLGRAAILRDPEGAAIGVAEPRVAVPAEFDVARPGTFVWMEMFSRTPQDATLFYMSLAGFSSTSVEVQGQVFGVLKSNRARAGVIQNPFEGVAPTWLPFVQVDNVTASVATAERLGGWIALRPQPRVLGGTVAIVADPTGGLLALVERPTTP